MVWPQSFFDRSDSYWGGAQLSFYYDCVEQPETIHSVEAVRTSNVELTCDTQVHLH